MCDGMLVYNQAARTDEVIRLLRYIANARAHENLFYHSYLAVNGAGCPCSMLLATAASDAHWLWRASDPTVCLRSLLYAQVPLFVHKIDNVHHATDDELVRQAVHVVAFTFGLAAHAGAGALLSMLDGMCKEIELLLTPGADETLERDQDLCTEMLKECVSQRGEHEVRADLRWRWTLQTAFGLFHTYGAFSPGMMGGLHRWVSTIRAFAERLSNLSSTDQTKGISVDHHDLGRALAHHLLQGSILRAIIHTPSESRFRLESLLCLSDCLLGSKAEVFHKHLQGNHLATTFFNVKVTSPRNMIVSATLAVHRVKAAIQSAPSFDERIIQTTFFDFVDAVEKNLSAVESYDGVPMSFFHAVVTSETSRGTGVRHDCACFRPTERLLPSIDPSNCLSRDPTSAMGEVLRSQLILGEIVRKCHAAAAVAPTQKSLIEFACRASEIRTAHDVSGEDATKAIEHLTWDMYDSMTTDTLSQKPNDAARRKQFIDVVRVVWGELLAEVENVLKPSKLFTTSGRTEYGEWSVQMMPRVVAKRPREDA
jgi:hypothetical protein